MKKNIFAVLLLLITPIISIHAVKVKMPSEIILYHRIVSCDNKNYLAKKTSLLKNLEYKELEVSEIINLVTKTIDEMKEGYTKENESNKLQGFLELIIGHSLEGKEELENIIKEWQDQNQNQNKDYSSDDIDIEIIFPEENK